MATDASGTLRESFSAAADHGQSALEQLIRRVRVIVDQRIADIAREIRVLVDAVSANLGSVQLNGHRHSSIVFFLGDVTVGEHAVEHQVATLEAVVRMVDGVVVRRRLGNARKRRRLDQRQIGSVLREVALRRRLDAVGTRAVVDGVQVHAQDVFFGVGLLHLQRQVHLAHLALDGDVVHL